MAESKVTLTGYSLADIMSVPSLRRYLDGMDEKTMKIALARAINRTMVHVRANTVRGLAAILFVRHKDIRSSLRLRKAHPAKLEGAMEGRGPKAIELYKFAPQPKTLPGPGRRRPPVGVSVRIRRDRRRVRVRGSFIARSASGSLGVFKRVRGDRSLPIRRLFGPAPMAYFLREYGLPAGVTPIYEVVENDIEEFFDRQLERELRFEAEVRQTLPARPSAWGRI